MNAPSLSTPPVMLMGFHYTPQYSRRTRIVVMGLVDQSTDAWEQWYKKMHEPEAIAAIAEAGYDLVEIHFLYGFGPRHEAEDVELTAQFVRHAHAVGLRVIGYFQFFSVQKETFSLEHPWAKDCLQRDADGTVRTYHYDRPALCFTHQRVRDYYLDGIELGLRHCDLDGIRLDNDYFRGCYCDACQAAFRAWLRETFDAAAVRRVFGLSTTEGMDLAPVCRSRDPLWLATVRFRQEQRQSMLLQLSRHLQQLKPEAILGGNPVISRRPNDVSRIHVYPPDLGETHHLVCAENDLFPGRDEAGLRSQVIAYKHGQANDFRVFASHHLHRPDGGLRWPETTGECALSLCEALAFGGHVPCTTWGLRMDDQGHEVLYRRPAFMDALRPVSAFLDAQAELYGGSICAAPIGIYVNRESLSGAAPGAAVALYGVVEALLTHQLPFRLMDRDEQPWDGLQLLIVPHMPFVSDAIVERLTSFAGDHSVLLLGEACRADEWMLARQAEALQVLRDARGCRQLPLDLPQMDADDTFHYLPRLAEAAAIADLVRQCVALPFGIEAPGTVGVELTRLPDQRLCLHLLNYADTATTVSLHDLPGAARVIAPEGFGAREVNASPGECRLRDLRTYAIVILEEASSP